MYFVSFTIFRIFLIVVEISVGKILEKFLIEREREKKNKFRYIWKNEIDVYFTKKCKFFLFKIGNDVWRRTMKLEYCPRQKECSISLEFYWWNNLSENFVSKMNDRKKKKNYFQNEYVRIPSIDSIRRIECIESDRIPNKLKILGS